MNIADTPACTCKGWRDFARAWTRLATFKEKLTVRPEVPRKSISSAVAAFEAHHEKKASETRRKYRTMLRFLCNYCERNRIEFVDEASLERLDAYVAERRKPNPTWLKDIEVLR